MRGSELFRECLSDVSNDIKIEIDLSFGIADKIDTLLKDKGLSQKDFAKKMGKSDAEVSRWLSGTHNFTLRTIAKISAALGCNILSVNQ